MSDKKCMSYDDFKKMVDVDKLNKMITTTSNKVNVFFNEYQQELQQSKEEEERANNKQKISRYRKTGEDIKRKMIDAHETTMVNMETILNALRSQILGVSHMNDLQSKYQNENKSLKKKDVDIRNVINISDRKTYYEFAENNVASSVYNVLWYLYIIMLISIVVVAVLKRKIHDKQVWKHIGLFVILPYIAYWGLLGIYLLFTYIMQKLKNVYLYENM